MPALAATWTQLKRLKFTKVGSALASNKICAASCLCANMAQCNGVSPSVSCIDKNQVYIVYVNINTLSIFHISYHREMSVYCDNGTTCKSVNFMCEIIGILISTYTLLAVCTLCFTRDRQYKY